MPYKYYIKYTSMGSGSGQSDHIQIRIIINKDKSYT